MGNFCAASEILSLQSAWAMVEYIPRSITYLSYNDKLIGTSQGVYKANMYQAHPFDENIEDELEVTGILWKTPQNFKFFLFKEEKKLESVTSTSPLSSSN